MFIMLPSFLVLFLLFIPVFVLPVPFLLLLFIFPFISSFIIFFILNLLISFIFPFLNLSFFCLSPGHFFIFIFLFLNPFVPFNCCFRILFKRLSQMFGYSINSRMKISTMIWNRFISNRSDLWLNFPPINLFNIKTLIHKFFITIITGATSFSHQTKSSFIFSIVCITRFMNKLIVSSSIIVPNPPVQLQEEL
ncbi:hypothetical protein V8G54_004097 [Vigna mungo]|uniref:Uncharacterized protein n=1 Tax=Vigna mungo TaxID=3915 RepID=A0AAQ3PFG7_VIGMU